MDKFRPKATANQRMYMRNLGISYPDNVSVSEANRLIQGRTGTSTGYKRVKLGDYVRCSRNHVEGNITKIEATGDILLMTKQGTVCSRIDEVTHV